MQTELISLASSLFPTVEHWKSFLELSDARDIIKDNWFIEATTKLRRHFLETLPAAWDCEPWGPAPNRDTRWYLREFGSDSFGICYSYHYRLDLKLHNAQKFNAQKVSDLLRREEYRPIQLAFDRIDVRYSWGSEFIEMRNFRFGTAQDGNFSERDLAWHAAHQMDSFVDQAVAKIERFTNNVKVTELLSQINQIAKADSPDGVK